MIKLSIIKVLSPRVTDRSPSDTLVTPVTDEPENKIPWSSVVSEERPPGLRRRKNVKGYSIYSDEDRSGESECCLSEEEIEDTKACNPWEPPISMSSDEPLSLHQDTLEIRTYTDAPSTVSIIFPSLLPLTNGADNASIASGASFASTTFDTLTYHRELREAQADPEFDQILARLISEWYYTGASVSVIFRSRFETPVLTLRPSSSLSPRKSPSFVSLRLPSDVIVLRSVDTTVIGFSPGNLFIIDSFAKRSLIISSVAAAIGLVVDVWFIFAYSGANVYKFQVSPTLSLILICKPYSSDDLLLWMCTDARDGRIRHILFLRTLVTLAPRCARRRCPRARRIPVCYCMDRVARRGARHVRIHGRAGQPAVHRVWLPPPRSGFRVDPARGVVGCTLFWEQCSGDFQASSEPGPHRRGRVARVANSSNASNRGTRFYLRYSLASRAYGMRI